MLALKRLLVVEMYSEKKHISFRGITQMIRIGSLLIEKTVCTDKV